MLFDGKGLSKIKRYAIVVTLSLMSFCILMTSLTKLVMRTYELLVDEGIIQEFDCNKITPHSHDLLIDTMHFLFYTSYFTSFIIGFYVLGIFYSFTFEYEYHFEIDTMSSADYSEYITEDLTNT